MYDLQQNLLKSTASIASSLVDNDVGSDNATASNIIYTHTLNTMYNSV